MQVLAVSSPQEPQWKWRIVNYAGEVVEESRETYPTIGSALEQGSKRLRSMNVVDQSVPLSSYHSTRHLRTR